MLAVHSQFIPDKVTFELNLPKDARFLTLAHLSEIPEMLFLVDRDATLETRYFMTTKLGLKIEYDRDKLIFMGIFARKMKYNIVFEVVNVSVQSAKLQSF